MLKMLWRLTKGVTLVSSFSLICLSPIQAEENTKESPVKEENKVEEKAEVNTEISTAKETETASTEIKGDIEKGKASAGACMGCHGPQGNAMAPNFPNLAGQKRVYLEKALKAYQSGERNDPIMKGMVISLKDNDIANLAAYYASLPSK